MRDSYWMPERLFWTAYLASRVRGQEKVPYWPESKLAKVRNSRVRSIIRFASRNVPYYRELFSGGGFDVEDFRTAEDLSKLPLLNPLVVRKDPDRFRPDNRKMDTLNLVSSGTTGVPRWIHHDAVSLFTNAAHGERTRFFYPEVSKRSRCCREAMIVVPLGSSAVEVQRFNRLKAWLPKRVSVRRRYYSMLDPMEDIIGELNRFRPDTIRAYGSGLNMLFEEVFRSGIDFHLPRSLVFSADSMAPGIRRKVTGELGVPVYGLYTSVECLQMGYECPEHRGYHLNEDCYPFRVLDENNPVPDGVAGKVIVSNLINRANVILNYELGDRGKILPGKCGCGRTQRMLSLNISRVADRLTLRDGTKIHPITFAEAVYAEKDLWQHQVIQRSEDEFDVLLVVDPSADRADLKQRLGDQFHRWIQGKVRFNLEFVDNIDLTSGGKHRAVVLMDQGDE